MKRIARRVLFLLPAIALVVLVSACAGVRRHSSPAGAQAVLDTAIEDIDAGRYEKLYHEAADQWRQAATMDQSKATLQTVRDRLGKAKTRNLQTAREEQTSTGPIAGHSFTAIYQTSFERGEGMETFTLLEHGGRWYLARYFVSSDALK